MIKICLIHFSGNIHHLEDAGWELDAVLNGGVEGIDHGWGPVPLPVCFVHLYDLDNVNEVRYYFHCYHLLPQLAPGVVGSPD